MKSCGHQGSLKETMTSLQWLAQAKLQLCTRHIHPHECTKEAVTCAAGTLPNILKVTFIYLITHISTNIEFKIPVQMSRPETLWDSNLVRICTVKSVHAEGHCSRHPRKTLRGKGHPSHHHWICPRPNPASIECWC